jgi:thiamine biosynthesis lipoprotein
MTEGTTFHIKVSKLPDSFNQIQLKKDIDNVLFQVDHEMSTYIKDSELSLINQSAKTDWIAISEGLYSVIKEAEKTSKLSGGAFDVTVGPLVNLWGFGPEPVKSAAPTDQQIQERMQKVGYQNISIKEQPYSIKKLIPDLYIDLSAIAKGYTVDQVGILLEKNGLQDYMVEIGGEVRVKGKNIKLEPWRIAVEKPTANERSIEKIILLSDIAMATSGDYRNFFEVDGVRFSHTINPKTGRPITHKLASVSVLSDTTMKADAMATALNVLGPELGFELAEKNKLAAFFIIKTDSGFQEKTTSAFAELTNSTR